MTDERTVEQLLETALAGTRVILSIVPNDDNMMESYDAKVAIYELGRRFKAAEKERCIRPCGAREPAQGMQFIECASAEDGK